MMANSEYIEKFRWISKFGGNSVALFLGHKEQSKIFNLYQSEIVRAIASRDSMKESKIESYFMRAAIAVAYHCVDDGFPQDAFVLQRCDFTKEIMMDTLCEIKPEDFIEIFSHWIWVGLMKTTEALMHPEYILQDTDAGS